MFSLIAWLIFGLIAGALARLLLPGSDRFTWLGTAVLGIIGSFVGGLLTSMVTGKGLDTVDPAGLVMSVIGAMITLVIYRRISSRG